METISRLRKMVECNFGIMTDDLICLARSVSELANHCENPTPVELDQNRVKSVWNDSEFAKSIGKMIPKDAVPTLFFPQL
jgi:hypothetical protein